MYGPITAFDFDISEEDEGFLMVPHATDAIVYPLRMVTPSGQVVDLFDDYRHHNIRLSEAEMGPHMGVGAYGAVGFDWPILVPFAPKHQALVESGTYRLEVASMGEPCFYVAPSRRGVVLDLNIYFVGLVDLSAASAAGDEDLQEVLAEVSALYDLIDVEIGQVRYRNVPRDVAGQFAILRDLEDIRELTAWGRLREHTRRGALSIDIFLVRSLMIDGSGVLLGASGGLPGAAGLHGSASNGLVFGVEGLGRDNVTVARIMAHEVGHYLGLRHTTEFVRGMGGTQESEFDDLVGTSDPITDTPVCTNILQQGSQCPDISNLMFPAVSPPSAPYDMTMTDGQGFVIQRSPLTHPAE